MVRLSVAGGASDEAQTVVAEAYGEDVAISNPNPGIGLAPDPLRLPSDATLRAELLEKAAEEIAAVAIVRATHAVAERQQAAVESARQGGEATASLEAEANAAYIQESTDREQAGTRLAELRAELADR